MYRSTVRNWKSNLVTIRMFKVGVYSRVFGRNSTKMFFLNLHCPTSCMRVYNGDLQITFTEEISGQPINADHEKI